MSASGGRNDGRAPTVPKQLRVSGDDPGAQARLTAALRRHLRHYLTRTAQRATPTPGAPPQTITVVCVGSDRSTGDALGPLVGTRLSQTNLPGLITMGTLEQPVHAANLAEYASRLKERGDQTLVIAVDACLGHSENVGTICVKNGPLRPGTGVNKQLPSIGQLHIVGVVNVGGFMEYFVLQNTRLSLVVRLADLIADSLLDAVTTVLEGFDQDSLLVAATREP